MSDGTVDEETMRKLKHDIKNQLSTIHLALENLKYETPDPTDDFKYCIETIFTSAAKINELLTVTD